MKRLTEKYVDRENKTQYQNACGINEFEYCGGREDMFNKLGKLEDIEEELGIDLNTLLKCKAIWFILPNEKLPRLAYHIHIDLYAKRLVDIIPEDRDDKPLYFYFKDYGKTWALTTEELK